MLNDGDGVFITESEPGPSLEACLEAILLVVDEPVAEVVLAQVLERPRDEVSRALAGLAASYDEQHRGYDLRQVAGGWRFYTREECAPVVERFVRDGQEVRLTQAALETLAVVAYRQPVSRSGTSRGPGGRPRFEGSDPCRSGFGPFPRDSPGSRCSHCELPPLHRQLDHERTESGL